MEFKEDTREEISIKKNVDILGSTLLKGQHSQKRQNQHSFFVDENVT